MSGATVRFREIGAVILTTIGRMNSFAPLSGISCQLLASEPGHGGALPGIDRVADFGLGLIGAGLDTQAKVADAVGCEVRTPNR
jgi:hypothetical protein